MCVFEKILFFVPTTNIAYYHYTTTITNKNKFTFSYHLNMWINESLRTCFKLNNTSTANTFNN